VSGSTDVATREAWVRRVLGVDVTGGSAAASRIEPVLPIWRDAKDWVDGQIERLRGAMRDTGVPAIARVADAGLNGITGRLQVGMIKELMEFDGAARAGDAQKTVGSAARLRGTIGEWRGFLGKDRVVGLLDANPWGVDVGLRQKLGEALDDIERALPA
jgi:hypothetical protein